MLIDDADWVILTYCCLSSFFNYLDRSAFANAYVAGLREDLDLHGADYNIVLSMFTAGSVIGQIPHGIIIQKFPPRIWLPSMVIVWSALTMSCAACKTYEQLCVVRFFQGFAEASTYCGTIYIIGSWYKPREIAKRTAIFTASGQAGTMFAGIMMTAIYTGMQNHSGLKGWQWLFLVNGIITIPIAIVGFLFFPDTPETTKARWLSPAERELALQRLPPKSKDGHNIDPWPLARRVFASPALYVLCGWAVITGALEAYVVQSLFLLWMKFHSDVFTQAQINTYPLGVQAVGIVSNFLAAVHVDATGKRVPMGVLACLLQLVAAVMLMVPTLPFAGTFFAYYLSGTSYMVNPVSYGWASIITQRGGDDAARSVILYAMNACSTCLYTFWGIALYPASDAPYCKPFQLFSPLWSHLHGCNRTLTALFNREKGKHCYDNRGFCHAGWSLCSELAGQAYIAQISVWRHGSARHCGSRRQRCCGCSTYGCRKGSGWGEKERQLLSLVRLARTQLLCSIAGVMACLD